MSNEKEKLLVYLVLYRYYEDTEVLGIFSSREKADVFIEKQNLPSGAQSVHEIEIDVEVDME